MEWTLVCYFVRICLEFEMFYCFDASVVNLYSALFYGYLLKWGGGSEGVAGCDFFGEE